MNNILIDALSDQAIKAASLIWKKDPAETREIIYRSIETREIEQRLTVPQFQEYLQLKVRPRFFSHCPVCGAETPPAFINCPSCNVNLEIVRNNAIQEFALELAKFGFIMGQKSTQPTPKKRTITLVTVLGWIGICFLLLIAYGIFKDLILFPLLYPAQPARTSTIPPVNTPKPKSTNVPIVTPQLPNCLLWSTITPQMAGQNLCIYGIVTDYTEDWNNELSRFYFGTHEQFFLVSNYRWDNPPEGECVTAAGEILLNTYNIPYIKIENFDLCN